LGGKEKGGGKILGIRLHWIHGPRDSCKMRNKAGKRGMRASRGRAGGKKNKKEIFAGVRVRGKYHKIWPIESDENWVPQVALVPLPAQRGGKKKKKGALPGGNLEESNFTRRTSCGCQRDRGNEKERGGWGM